MADVRSFRRTIVLAAVLVILGTAFGAARAQSGNAAPRREFDAFLGRVDAAQLELQNGKAAAFKALWSHADDVTLSGGFGGTIEKGWQAVGSRLDWVGTQFSNGTNRIDRTVSNDSGDLGYVIQAEHLRFRVPGQASDSTRDYRVTMIFRREAGEWRIVHRQADSNNVKQAPQ
jgi:ketosteroid isomerase-like protein